MTQPMINLSHDYLFALKPDLGWVLVDYLYMGNSHNPGRQNYKTDVLDKVGASFFTWGQSCIQLKEKLSANL